MKSVISFKRRLLRWYRQQARDLPWRRTRDPYRIIVSEFMLQQTQVSRVEQFYGKFLARYPTIQALAAAKARAVRETWQGLGYYRRAANLHALAQAVVKQHRGVVPRDTSTLVTLPGVGAYTAGAVACFAYEQREAAVDTNVRRVLGRYFGRPGGRTGKQAGRKIAGRLDGRTVGATKRIWDLARAILPKSRRTTWEFNQALMDLGATVCLARSPRCGVCPVQTGCSGRLDG